MCSQHINHCCSQKNKSKAKHLRVNHHVSWLLRIVSSLQFRWVLCLCTSRLHLLSFIHILMETIELILLLRWKILTVIFSYYLTLFELINFSSLQCGRCQYLPHVELVFDKVQHRIQYEVLFNTFLFYISSPLFYHSLRIIFTMYFDL